MGQPRGNQTRLEAEAEKREGSVGQGRRSDSREARVRRATQEMLPAGDPRAEL